MTQFVVARSFALPALAVFSFVLGACATNRSPSGCTPGTSVACVCTTRVAGTQSCQSDHTFGECDCTGVPSDAGTPDATLTDGASTLRDLSIDFGPIDGATDAGPAADASRDGSIAESCISASSCNDLNECTADDCVSGHCVHLAIDVTSFCDDGNLCTTDTCAARTGCAHTNNSDPCEDGNFCSVNDTCSGGVCTRGDTMVCGSGCVCNETDDACEAVHPGAACLAVEF